MMQGNAKETESTPSMILPFIAGALLALGAASMGWGVCGYTDASARMKEREAIENEMNEVKKENEADQKSQRELAIGPPWPKSLPSPWQDQRKKEKSFLLFQKLIDIPLTPKPYGVLTERIAYGVALWSSGLILLLVFRRKVLRPEGPGRI